MNAASILIPRINKHRFRHLCFIVFIYEMKSYHEKKAFNFCGFLCFRLLEAKAFITSPSKEMRPVNAVFRYRNSKNLSNAPSGLLLYLNHHGALIVRDLP
ncbi:hypothetical protein Syun_008693 [Stephania yunnanensis]|uniref:Uncharacterized protein n=1 Tax=Stephania yunnanensis TaxID=152371 RepID=A0AAP0PPW6_9MAGN